MIKCEKTHNSISKEEEDKKENLKKSNLSLNSDLNVIEESQENIKNREDEHLSEEESLGYNSNYKIFQNNAINKDNQFIKDKLSKRKASTVSTTLSLTDTYSETNSFLPPNNNIKCQNYERKSSYTQPQQIFFGRERLYSTPVTSYFEGLDYYLRGLQPEKNEYQKSNNYIEKDIFFKEKNFNYKDYKYKSFDLAEQKMFNSNKILKENIENPKKLEESKPGSFLNIENNYKNNINNNQNIFNPMTQKINNNIYGKFDMPMYYFGYYNFDCK